MSNPEAREERDSDWSEWVDHLLPIKFFRTLWEAMFPARFRRLVLESLDGTPPSGYSRPITFALGCFLLGAAVITNFPFSSADGGIDATFTAVPTAERHALSAALGIDRLDSVSIPDQGRVRFTSTQQTSISRHLRSLTGPRIGRITARELAQYLESHGQADLALRVRGYVDRTKDREHPFSETILVVFFAVGLVPGWAISHAVLGGGKRTVRETRYVHMYNDGWLVVGAFVPLWLSIYCASSFESRAPTNVLMVIALVAGVYWLFRTPRLYRATHGVAWWRVAAAHTLGITATLLLAMALAVGLGMLSGLEHRFGL